MKYSGVIFDFNGTLYWDADKQEESWRLFSRKLRGYEMSSEELQRVMHGRTSRSIIEYLVGSPIDNKTLTALVEEKEQIYRDMCEEDAPNLKLVPGATELLDYLTKNKTARTIATSSEKVNVDFFFKVLELYRWFDINKVVYDDGKLRGKPEPDIFLKASERIGIDPEYCIAVEDSISGIEAACRANIGKIIAIGPKSKHEYLKEIKGVDCIISNFNEFDRSILCSLV